MECYVYKKDDFVTNTSYDCRRTLRKQAQRRDRRVYGNPYIKGPVYVNRMQEPDRGTFSSKTAVDVKKEETLLAKSNLSLLQCQLLWLS